MQLVKNCTKLAGHALFYPKQPYSCPSTFLWTLLSSWTVFCRCVRKIGPLTLINNKKKSNMIVLNFFWGVYLRYHYNYLLLEQDAYVFLNILQMFYQKNTIEFCGKIMRGYISLESMGQLHINYKNVYTSVLGFLPWS